MTATVTRTAVVPTTSEIGPTMMIGTKLATETSMFEDAEDAAADVLRQVLLELGLRRDRHEPVGDPGEEAR